MAGNMDRATFARHVIDGIKSYEDTDHVQQLTRLADKGLLNQAILESVVPLFQRVIRLLEPRAASEKRIGCTLLSVMPIKEGFRLLACPRVRASDALRSRRAQACRP